MRNLLKGHPEGLVAVRSDGPRTLRDLQRDVAAVVKALPAEGTGAGDRVLLVFEQDRYALLVAVLATWARGLAALVPPNTKRATLSALKARPDVRAVLHDTPSGIPTRVTDHLQEPGPGPVEGLEALEAAASIEAPAPRLGFVAASTGEVRDLDGPTLAAELMRWREFAPLVPGDRVIAPAPMGHRWGFVGGLLHPYASDAVLDREASVSPIALWVGMPGALPEPGRAHRVLSGGARLREGAPPETLDVLTSTATGPLAVRSSASPHWRPLTGVTLADGRFRGSEGSSEDRFDEVEGGFRLRSRAGRSVGAVDLDALEDELRGLSGVEEVALFPIPGREGLVGGFRGMADAEAVVRTHCEGRVPGTVDVRRLSYPLPRDPLGRVSRSALLRLRALGPEATPRKTELEDVRVEGNTVRFRVPRTYRWFDGHFEGYPILPAAVQLEAVVLPFARSGNWLEGEPLRFERLKFSGRIEPGAELELIFSAGKPGALDFEIRDASRRLTAGRIRSGNEG